MEICMCESICDHGKFVFFMLIGWSGYPIQGPGWVAGPWANLAPHLYSGPGPGGEVRGQGRSSPTRPIPIPR